MVIPTADAIAPLTLPSVPSVCCGEVGKPGSPDKIGSLEGNKVSVDCSYQIDNKVTLTVPVWDTAGGLGASGWYQIVGFSGFQITECRGGNDIAGVWRRPFSLGPTTTNPGFPGTALAVQLAASVRHAAGR